MGSIFFFLIFKKSKWETSKWKTFFKLKKSFRKFQQKVYVFLNKKICFNFLLIFEKKNEFSKYDFVSAGTETGECIDTPGWDNGYSYGCKTYTGWICKHGSFVSGMEGFGSTKVGKNSACEPFLESPENDTCADVFNYPELNCCSCGKTRI